MIRIVLADDHTVVRQGVKSLLQDGGDMSVIGEVEDGLAVADQVELLRPDVLVLDLVMPGLNGLEVIRQVKRRTPKTQIVVLSMHASESYIIEALRNGAAGYVIKDADAQHLIEAIHSVYRGKRYICPHCDAATIEKCLADTSAALPDPYESLTDREREVLQLAAEGHSNAEIATRLFISKRTAETHRQRMMRKLNLASQVELVRYALLRGIISLDTR